MTTYNIEKSYEKNKFPDERGRFGEFGGQFVPETLMPALIELEKAFEKIRQDEKFQKELENFLSDYAGRPTPLYFAEKLSKRTGCRIYLKREDLLHTGAHKINNTLGQALLAKYMGKRRITAETGAGQHGVATAVAGAVLGFPVDIYMGVEDIERQAPNVSRMKLCGAKVIPVSSGTGTLKDAVNEALRDWIARIEDTYYVLGSVVGPHPYPLIVREFQRIIGEETKSQILEKEGKLPAAVIACVGGGSNSIGIFYDFIDEKDVRLIGVEAGGLGLSSGKHGASLCAGTVGVLQGTRSYLLQDKDGQIIPAHSVSAGLDYPGVGPEHAFLKSSGRTSYAAVNDKEALEAFVLLSREEGIIPALEPAHAISYAMKISNEFEKDDSIIICLSGRGDKDLDHALDAIEEMECND